MLNIVKIMNRILLLSGIIASYGPICILSLDEPIVELFNGKIIGRNQENHYSFEMIPYAIPPLGSLRFKSPMPYIQNWIEPYNATHLGPACIQWDHFKFEKSRLVGEEDCLHLNVYTPYNFEQKKLPVIVYIHGGAFMFGSGGLLKQDLIMESGNTVLVTFNYRVGPMGFLSTEDAIISGNMGLKDQHLAVKWVKDNIEHFGGDPEKILLSGFSSGGASVHLHLLSKQTEQLNLKSAISFSGTATCPWAIVNNPLERTKKLASLLDCSTDNSLDMINCLQLQKAEDIVKSVDKFLKFLYYPFTVFGPVIESKFAEDAFLTEMPEKLISDGKAVDVPWLVSYVKDEGGYPAAELLKSEQENNSNVFLHEFLERFDELVPIVLFSDKLEKELETQQLLDKLKDKYELRVNSGTAEADLVIFERIKNMFTNEIFKNGILKSVHLHATHSKSKCYLYLYNNPAEFGLGQILANRTDIDFGTVHGDDVFLIFNFPGRDQFKFRPDEEAYSKKFIKMMRNFAVTGNLVFGNQEVPPNEPNSDKLTYLKITKEKASIVIEDY